MTSSVHEIAAQSRRMHIIQLLAKSTDYAHNDAVIQATLAEVAHRVPRDMIRTDLGWLAQRGLVTIQEVGGGTYVVATLTRAGKDVADGASIVTGIARPEPGV